MKYLVKMIVLLVSLSLGGFALTGCEQQPTEETDEAAPADEEAAAQQELAAEEEAAEEEAAEEEAAEEEAAEEEAAEEEADDEHAVVESGTYKGTITEVNAEESEIYVDADGQELELYFIEQTELTHRSERVEFSKLEEGQKVEVEIKKVGKRLDPLSVKILE